MFLDQALNNPIDLLVVEDKGGDCGVWSRAWPVGFIRAGGDLGGTPTSEAPPEG